MAIQVSSIKRVFRYNGVTLQDPGPTMSLAAVQALFAPQFPELTNAVIEGPVTKGNTATYTFTRAVGSKG